uniref:FBA domain-containing protein n=1 Tax=Plectus sambesii TaxID=2011161 RepID=A0A914USB2_9BILA
MTSGPCLLDDLLVSDDFLREILLRVSDLRTLTYSCPLVSKRWLSLTVDPKFWLEKCEYDDVALPPVHLRKEHAFDYKRILVKRPYNRNLIRNPSGEEELNFWKIMKRDGSGWTIESPPVYCDGRDFLRARATSLLNKVQRVKEQRIDLIAIGVEALVLDEVKPKIIVSERVSAREDRGYEYQLSAALGVVDEDGLISDVDEREETVEKPQWSAGQWQKVEIVFSDYPKGTREVVLRSGGKDSLFWYGHSGPRMTEASIMVVFD